MSPGDRASKPAGHVIVCVDDELPILRSIERLLREEPFQLLTTQDPQQALEWVESREISLVIADYRMPEMTGSDLLEAVWATSPKTARILFTGYPGETMILRGMGRGIYNLVAKPWSDDKLKDAIRKALRERDADDAS